MSYHSLAECVGDLLATGQLVRIEDEVDPHLEVAEIHRRVNQAGGPALYYARVKGCRFPLVSNLFGTVDRARYLFRDSLEAVRALIACRIDPSTALARPWRQLTTIRAALAMIPKRTRRGPVLESTTDVRDLPHVQCWPHDAGAFVTLPLVYTEDPRSPGWRKSNLGMYRIQLSGGQYVAGREVGLHYQIHRGIGVHHAAARAVGQALPVNVFVGGPPAMTLAAVMPLPEGISELAFAGALGGRRLRLAAGHAALPIWVDADFCITGRVDPTRTLPEGPFGDHQGYYSLAHPFPVLEVEQVFHRRDAIWPFTVVGRPPQEDTVFGKLIHEITGPVMSNILPGVKAVHAVDEAGVHPLLLAIGSERYTPFSPVHRPQEILTQANAILGQGQLSLAKYLWIVNGHDVPDLDIGDVERFFVHVLMRVDWRRDLHFLTETTIDTLDYSGPRLNQGSKLIIAAAGPAVRELPTNLSPSDGDLPGIKARAVLPGCLVIEVDPYDAASVDQETGQEEAVARLCASAGKVPTMGRFPLWVVVDDADFCARSLRNFLWVAFTRSNPACDVHGVGSFVRQKHWGCQGPLVIDARIKPHHAPVVESDPNVARRVERLAAGGGPLCGLI